MHDEPLDTRLWTLPTLEVLKRVSVSRALERATWHPLGFVHTELAREADFALRFHIWPPRERRSKSPDWQVHNHVFALTSRVLVGSIQNTIYDLIDVKENKAEKQLYAVQYGDGYSELVPLQRYVTIAAASVQTYKSGDVYEVACGAFHESNVELTGLAATLVRTDLQSTTAPLVAGEVDVRDGRSYKYQRVPVAYADVRCWIEMAMGAP